MSCIGIAIHASMACREVFSRQSLWAAAEALGKSDGPGLRRLPDWVVGGIARMTTSTRITIGVGSCIVALAAFLALGGCTSIARCVSLERRPLTFVGQISFATPLVRESRVIVPLTFTGGEWGRHSAIAINRVESHISGRAIEMTVLTSLVGDEPVPRELRLGRVAPGQYSVAYRDPDGTRHRLGQIEIPTIR